LLPMPGDFDGDRDVDAADYDAWLRGFGAHGAMLADGNGDQVVDAADYVIWRKNAAVGGGSVIAAVPEPHAAYLLSVLSLLLFSARKRTRLN
jgi:hypothetical protein